MDPNQQQNIPQQAAPQGQAQPQAGANTGAEDYADKGLDFIEQKTGHSLGRDTNEKITDGARGMFEKLTGKKVPEKFSN